MKLPNQLNIIARAIFIFMGYYNLFESYSIWILIKMQIPTEYGVDRFLLFQLVWRLSEFAFFVRFTSVAALFYFFCENKSKKL